MLRSLPPAGHGISLVEIGKSFFQSSNTVFIRQLGYKVPYFFVSSGTAALCLSLKANADESPRKQVILPAYTCPSLLAAVVKARLVPILCDLQPNTFQIDPEQLESKITEKTLGVIAVHLFGLPENIAEIKKRVRGKNITIIEDAAQALGNSFAPDVLKGMNGSAKSDTQHELMLGLMGDIGVLSFGRGKPLSMLGGGAVLVNNADLLEHIKTAHDLVDGQDTFSSRFGYVAKLILYSLFFHPSLYWIPARTPGLRLGETYFSLDIDLEKINQHIISIGNIIVSRLSEIRQTRLRVAALYRKALDRFRNELAYIPEYDDDYDRVALLRFPIIFKKKEKRGRILLRLRAKGLGATGMYPSPLNEIQDTSPYLSDRESYPAAKSVSQRILTLPLHENVSQRDIEKIVRVFEST